MSKTLCLQPETWFHVLANNSCVGLYLLFENQFLYVNAKFAEIFGYTPEELVAGKSLEDIIAPTDRTLLGPLLTQQLQRNSQLLHIGIEGLRKDGSFVNLEWSGTYIELDNQFIISGSIIEVPKLAQSHAPLSFPQPPSLQNFEEVVKGIFYLTPSGEYINGNLALATLYGYNSSTELMNDLTQSVNQKYVHSSQYEEFLKLLITRQEVCNFEAQMYQKNGEIIWISQNIRAIKDWKGEVFYYEGTVENITKRKQSEEVLKDSLKYLADIKFALDKSAIVAITDAKGVIQYVNDKFCSLSQYSRQELLGKSHQVINSGYHSRQFFKTMWQTISAGKVWHGEIKNRAKDGSCYWVDTTIVPILNEANQPIEYLAIRFEITNRKEAEESLKEAKKELEQRVQDRTQKLQDTIQKLNQEIHERKMVELALRQSEKELENRADQLEKTLQELQQAQLQLIQNEKMSALGELVAGIAHEINNPVNFIYGNLIHASTYTNDLLKLIQLYQDESAEPTTEIINLAEEMDLEFLKEDLPNLLESMKVGADRIRGIVKSLRNFSRLDESQMKPVNIHEGIDSTLLILQNRLKANPDKPEIQVIKKYGNLPEINCYACQLNQVFMNLIANAIDALEKIEQNCIITIQTEVIELPRSDQAKPQYSALIRISDNGSGIPPEIQTRLFDPFFTTKPIGKGTGLGLSISYQIVVEKHQGQLRCISQAGKGSEFQVEIPL